MIKNHFRAIAIMHKEKKKTETEVAEIKLYPKVEFVLIFLRIPFKMKMKHFCFEVREKSCGKQSTAN